MIAALAEAVRGMPRLTRLEFQAEPLNVEGTAVHGFVSALSGMRSLEQLNLNLSHFPCSAAEPLFTVLATLPQLTKLALPRWRKVADPPEATPLTPLRYVRIVSAWGALVRSRGRSCSTIPSLAAQLSACPALCRLECRHAGSDLELAEGLQARRAAPGDAAPPVAVAGQPVATDGQATTGEEMSPAAEAGQSAAPGDAASPVEEKGQPTPGDAAPPVAEEGQFAAADGQATAGEEMLPAAEAGQSAAAAANLQSRPAAEEVMALAAEEEQPVAAHGQPAADEGQRAAAAACSRGGWFAYGRAGAGCHR